MWFSKLGKLCTRADIFGNSFGMNFRGQSTHKTLPGGILSVICTLFLIWFAVRLVYKVFDRSSPKVELRSEFVKSGTHFNLAESELLPALSIINRTSGEFLDATQHQKFVTFKAEVVTYFTDFDSNTNKKTRKFLDFVPCKDLKNKKPYEKFNSDPKLIKKINDEMSCIEVPPSEKLEVHGVPLSDTFQYFKVSAYPCSLPNKGECIEPSVLNEVEMGVFELKKYFHAADFKDPIRYAYTAQVSYYFSKEVGSLFKRILGRVRVEDNTNSILDDSVRGFTWKHVTGERQSLIPRQASQTTCKTEDFESEIDCLPYLSFHYYFSGEVDTYLRTYPDVYYAFAEFGGFQEFLTTLFILALYFYNNKESARALRYEILGVESLTKLVKDLPNHPRSSESKKDSKKRISQIKRLIKTELNDLADSFCDVVNLVKELSCIFLLSRVIMAPHQRKLATLAVIEVMRKSKEKEGSGPGDAHHDMPAETYQSIEEYYIQEEDMKYTDALRILRRDPSTPAYPEAGFDGHAPNSPCLDEIRSVIENIIKTNLPNLHSLNPADGEKLDLSSSAILDASSLNASLVTDK